MDSSELRLGNYVNYEQTTHIITGLLREACLSNWFKALDEEDAYLHRYNEISPIPITNKKLRKLGGTFDSGYWVFQDQEGWEVKFFQDKKGLMFIFPKNNVRLDYIHELQNLFYELTKENLPYKLTK